MSMSNEFERHIRANRNAGKLGGAIFLEAMRTQFDIARNSGILIELPLSHSSSIQRTVTRSIKANMQEVDGDRILEARRIRGLTQAEVAEAVGVSKGYISNLEHKRQKRVSPFRGEQIATFLGVELDDLKPQP